MRLVPPRPDKAEAVNAEHDRAFCQLLAVLKRRRYRFVTPTPASHARVVARPERSLARNLTDVLGWSRPFRAGHVDAEIEGLLEDAGALDRVDGQLRTSKVRVSSLQGQLFLHSAFPTDAPDSVFFGPDSYRFANLLVSELERAPCAPGARIVDIGAGAGAGAVTLAGLIPGARIAMTDINPLALRFARINAQEAGVEAEYHCAASLDYAVGEFDLAVANPPFIVDNKERAYRDGGGMHGGEVALEMARAALPRLSPAGRLILYTGSAILDGEDRLKRAIQDLGTEFNCAFSYRELDPDVFGEELRKPAYRDVDRIAVVAAILTANAAKA